MAVVNLTQLGQDGLIGDAAPSRLKGGLGFSSIDFKWFGPRGNQELMWLVVQMKFWAKLIRLGIVTGDVPLLLPIKMLRNLQSLIEFENNFVFLRTLNQSVELRAVSSGHIAIGVLNFGAQGFRCPPEAVQDGYSDYDFRLDLGSQKPDVIHS